MMVPDYLLKMSLGLLSKKTGKAKNIISSEYQKTRIVLEF
jgi:hypothetical protein